MRLPLALQDSMMPVEPESRRRSFASTVVGNCVSNASLQRRNITGLEVLIPDSLPFRGQHQVFQQIGPNGPKRRLNVHMKQLLQLFLALVKVPGGVPQKGSVGNVRVGRACCAETAFAATTKGYSVRRGPHGPPRRRGLAHAARGSSADGGTKEPSNTLISAPSAGARLAHRVKYRVHALRPARLVACRN